MYCKCGCNTPIKPFDKRGRPVLFVRGHSNKGKNNTWKIKTIVKRRTYHERANKIIQKSKCKINNEQCSLSLEIAHIDGDFTNNNPNNLACLCASHHRLLDLGKIPFNKLHEIRLFIVSSGKRRYK